MITIDRSYSGHVSPDSDPQQRDVPGARIVKMSVGGMDNNCYLVQCTGTGAALLIDAANDAPRWALRWRRWSPAAPSSGHDADGW